MNTIETITEIKRITKELYPILEVDVIEESGVFGIGSDYKFSFSIDNYDITGDLRFMDCVVGMDRWVHDGFIMTLSNFLNSLSYEEFVRLYDDYIKILCQDKFLSSDNKITFYERVANNKD